MSREAGEIQSTAPSQRHRISQFEGRVAGAPKRGIKADRENEDHV